MLSSIICHSHTICMQTIITSAKYKVRRWENVAEENVLVTRSVWVIQFKVVAFRKTPDESSVQKEVDQSRVLSPPSVRPSICSTVKTARQLSLLFRHASVSSTYPCQSVGHTFELLESRSCNAAHFLSLLESKGEDYLMLPPKHQFWGVFSDPTYIPTS